MRSTSTNSGACLRSWTTPVQSSHARGSPSRATLSRSRVACHSASPVEQTCCALPRCRERPPTHDLSTCAQHDRGHGLKRCRECPPTHDLSTRDPSGSKNQKGDE